MNNNQLPVPNAVMPMIQQQQNNSAVSSDMLRHLYLQAAQKQQLRISPLPNGKSN